MSALVRVTDPQASVVAVDGSVAGGWLGSAYLGDTGSWRLRSRRLRAPLSGRESLHAELYAVADAVRDHSGDLIVLCDSTAVVDLVDAWRHGTARPVPGYRGQRLVSLAVEVRHRTAPIRVWWVRGHNGHPLNEGADALASLARRSGEWGWPRDRVRDGAAKAAATFAVRFMTDQWPHSRAPSGRTPS